MTGFSPGLLGSAFLDNAKKLFLKYSNLITLPQYQPGFFRMRIKRLLIPTLTFFLGAAVAVGIMSLRIREGHQLIYCLNQMRGSMDQTRTAKLAIYGTLAYEKRNEELEQGIEDEFLTSLILQKDMKFVPNPYFASKKIIRSYFDLTNRPVPPAIDREIRSVPKGGSGIDIRSIADAWVRSSHRVWEVPVPSPSQRQ